MHFHKYFLVNQAPTSHVGGKISTIPWRVGFQIYFIGKECHMFWQLSVKDFYRYLGQQYAMIDISSSLYISFLDNKVYNVPVVS